MCGREVLTHRRASVMLRAPCPGRGELRRGVTPPGCLWASCLLRFHVPVACWPQGCLPVLSLRLLQHQLPWLHTPGAPFAVSGVHRKGRQAWPRWRGSIRSLSTSMDVSGWRSGLERQRPSRRKWALWSPGDTTAEEAKFPRSRRGLRGSSRRPGMHPGPSAGLEFRYLPPTCTRWGKGGRAHGALGHGPAVQR